MDDEGRLLKHSHRHKHWTDAKKVEELGPMIHFHDHEERLQRSLEPVT